MGQSFIGVQFTNIQKNTQCSSHQVSTSVKMWFMYTMEYYSAIRNDKYPPFASKWMELEGIMLSEVSQLEKDNIHCLSFSNWLTSLSVIPSSSIHVEANGGYLSFLMAEEYSIVYIDHSFFIHSSFDGHRGSFHSLAIVAIADRNIGVQVSQRFIASESLG